MVHGWLHHEPRPLLDVVPIVYHKYIFMSTPEGVDKYPHIDFYVTF